MALVLPFHSLSFHLSPFLSFVIFFYIFSTSFLFSVPLILFILTLLLPSFPFPLYRPPLLSPPVSSLIPFLVNNHVPSKLWKTRLASRQGTQEGPKVPHNFMDATRESKHPATTYTPASQPLLHPGCHSHTLSPSLTFTSVFHHIFPLPHSVKSLPCLFQASQPFHLHSLHSSQSLLHPFNTYTLHLSHRLLPFSFITHSLSFLKHTRFSFFHHV